MSRVFNLPDKVSLATHAHVKQIARSLGYLPNVSARTLRTQRSQVLDFVLSDEGQAIWANACLRPVRATALSAEVQSRFLPASDYARAKTVDYNRMAVI